MITNGKIPFLDLVTPHRELEEELLSVFRTALHTAAFVGRENELARLIALRDEAAGRLVSACDVGEPGIGKTRLIAAIAERAALAGDLVVGVGPHDSGARPRAS